MTEPIDIADAVAVTGGADSERAITEAVRAALAAFADLRINDKLVALAALTQIVTMEEGTWVKAAGQLH
jgi:hypothetical protein